MVWQFDVPGTQMVTLVKSVSTKLLVGPAFTTTLWTLFTEPLPGLELLVEGLELLPPHPSSNIRLAKDTRTHPPRRSVAIPLLSEIIG
jgi:hypothetical protein